MINPDAVAALSPYITQHIDRFGRYSLEMDQPSVALEDAVFTDAWLPAGRAAGASRRSVGTGESMEPENDERAEQLTFERWLQE